MPENTYIDDAMMFDIPDSEFIRDGRQTTFEKLLLNWLEQRKAENQAASTFSSNSLALGSGDKLAQIQGLRVFNKILHDMEVNTWQPNELAVSSMVEEAFRELQQEFQREAIPRQCYMNLFDQIFDRLMQGGELSLASAAQLKPKQSCMIDPPISRSSQLVKEIAPPTITQYLKRGQKVVFIDVREPEEFEEVHIPGAMNIQIRNLNGATLEKLKSADLIVSYCVKDFRGYEMAAKIARGGFQNSVIMKPYGIKGWIDAGFPVYSGTGNEEVYIEAMHQCLLGLSSCSGLDKPLAASSVVL